MRELKEQLRRRRQENKMTQESISRRLLVHRTTYAKYESGVVDPPLETLCRLADVLGCTTDALLGRE